MAQTTAWISSGALGFTIAFGIFNRITFPAFLIIPIYRLLQPVLRSPLNLLPLGFVALATSALAVYVDTAHYTAASALSRPVVTPLNNILYNSDSSNLAAHGLHPRWTHLLVNVPQLLGPALLLRPWLPLFTSATGLPTAPVLSALGGVLVLSILPHQEARFLLPVVPLLLASATLPTGRQKRKAFKVAWVVFNSVAAIFFGFYHQAGVVPAQIYLSSTNATDAVYWKTYNPPTWLLGAAAAHVNTTNLMGASVPSLLSTVREKADCGGGARVAYLVAPFSATRLDPLLDAPELPFRLEMEWSTRQHLNIDDLDFRHDGAVETLKRLVGRRGLGVWRIKPRAC